MPDFDENFDVDVKGFATDIGKHNPDFWVMKCFYS